MQRNIQRLLGACSISLAAFVMLACPVDIPSAVPDGNWGGEHIGIVVSDTGATIEYDCATGTIDEPLRLDASGSFDWHGTHVIGHGGPIMIGESPDEHPAEYTGHADAKQMTITLRLTDTTTFTPRTFTLERGANPRVFRCL
jgi:hypothetical protein